MAPKNPSREDDHVVNPLSCGKALSRRAASFLIVVAFFCCTNYNVNKKVGPVSTNNEFKTSSNELMFSQHADGTAQLMHMHNATPPLAGGLWIYVSSWAEGISSWRQSVTEILIVARRLNATFVEPCICLGRLFSCQQLLGGGHSTQDTHSHSTQDTHSRVPTRCIDSGTITKLSDIFDMERIKQFHPAIASFDDFQRHNDALKTELATKQQASFTMCMYSGNPKDACGKIESWFGSERSMELKKAVHQSHLVRTTLEVTHLRKYAFFNMTLDKVKLVKSSEVTSVAHKYLDFRSEHYQIVDRALEEMGVNKNFSVIHWRAELKNMDYMECARAILKARDQMHTPDRQFVLMSSLNMDESLQWGGARRRTADNSSAHAALSLLLDTGFYKLDTVLEHDKDIVRFAIWDIILAVKAQAFGTCSGCAESAICAKCNFQGNFARWAVDMRQMSGKQSRKCWR